MVKRAHWICGLVGTLTLVASPAQTPKPTSSRPMPIKAAIRRITESQYRHTIADLFGPEIKIKGRFEPEKREERLLAIGNAQLSLTSSGFERYFAFGNLHIRPSAGRKTKGCFRTV